MCLIMDRAQPGDRDVGVELGGGQRGVAEQFLHDPQVGPALEQMGRCTVPQSVRADIGSAGDCTDGLVHHGAGLPRVEPTTPRTQQQIAAMRPKSRGSRPVSAAASRPMSRSSVRDENVY